MAKGKSKPKQDGCINCRHWRRFEDCEQTPKEDIRGQCALHPPTVVGVDMVTREILQAQPIVPASMLCGDHFPMVH